MIKIAHLIVCWLLISPSVTVGQNYSKKFGEIGKEEIELQKYALNKEAEAVVFFDIGKSHFIRSETSFDVVFERSTRIKILSDAGIKWAEVEIPFYEEGGINETVYDIEAYSYTIENSQIVKTPFDVSKTYDEKINNYWNVKKFAIPNVKAGSIIEYKYSISSQYKFNLRDWEFQWKIPVIHSEYEVKMIPFFEYSWLLQGANKFDYQNSFVSNGLSRQFGPTTFQDMVHQYIMKDIPAFDNEEFITSKNDYIRKIDFQLSRIYYPDGAKVTIMTTWEDMTKELLKHKDFGKYMNKAEKLSLELIPIESIGLKTDKERFDLVLDYMKGNFNWDNTNSKYASKSPAKLLEEKHGNCADINLFTVGFLNALGIEAQPVLISTRENGKIKYDYPYTHFFDYVIILANIDGTFVLTDATEVLSLNNRIPSRCINDKGLVVQKEKVEWIGLECLFSSEIKTDIQTEFINPESFISTVTKTASEYDGLYYRNSFTDKKEVVKKGLENKDYSLIDSSITVINQLDIEKPYILNYKLTGNPEIVNDKIYVSPFLNLPISDNPLKQKERTYPIDLTYPKKRLFNAAILIPDGYQVDHLPTELTINNQLFELAYSTNLEGNKIHLTLKYDFKESVYPSDEYSKVKFFFNEIVRKGNEKIVLTKKVGEVQ